jgi:hypothetical protein
MIRIGWRGVSVGQGQWALWTLGPLHLAWRVKFPGTCSRCASGGHLYRLIEGHLVEVEGPVPESYWRKHDGGW